MVYDHKSISRVHRTEMQISIGSMFGGGGGGGGGGGVGGGTGSFGIRYPMFP